MTNNLLNIPHTDLRFVIRNLQFADLQFAK